MSNVMTVGLDLAKNSFYAVAVNCRGKQQWREKFTRRQLAQHFIQHLPCRMAMDACAISHYWPHTLEAMGHEVVLLPPQHVEAYLRGQRNDYNDAKTITEACWANLVLSSVRSRPGFAEPCRRFSKMPKTDCPMA